VIPPRTAAEQATTAGSGERVAQSDVYASMAQTTRQSDTVARAVPPASGDVVSSSGAHEVTRVRPPHEDRPKGGRQPEGPKREDATRMSPALDKGAAPTRVEGLPLRGDDDDPATMLRPPPTAMPATELAPDQDFHDRTRPRLNSSKVIVNTGPVEDEAPLSDDAIFTDTTRKVKHQSTVPLASDRRDELPTSENDLRGKRPVDAEPERTRIAIPVPAPQAPHGNGTQAMNGSPIVTAPPQVTPSVVVNQTPLPPAPSPTNRTPMAMAIEQPKRTIMVSTSPPPMRRDFATTGSSSLPPPVVRTAAPTVGPPGAGPSALLRAAIIVSTALVMAAVTIIVVRGRAHPRPPATQSAAAPPPAVATTVIATPADVPPDAPVAVAVTLLASGIPSGSGSAALNTPAPPPTMSAGHDSAPKKKKARARHDL
jgi:hypothetical protein